MREINVFNNISLDGYFTDAHGDMSWAHEGTDAEWAKFSSENARNSNATLLFGRKTYELMASFWPTAQAKQQMPEVADGMNRMHKVVFSKTLARATWNNTSLVAGNLAGEVRKLKAEAGEPILIMGSGTLVAQLTKEHLIDSYTFVIVPVVLGAGRTLFEGVEERVNLKRIRERAFGNGNVVVTYKSR